MLNQMVGRLQLTNGMQNDDLKIGFSKLENPIFLPSQGSNPFCLKSKKDILRYPFLAEKAGPSAARPSCLSTAYYVCSTRLRPLTKKQSFRLFFLTLVPSQGSNPFCLKSKKDILRYPFLAEKAGFEPALPLRTLTV